MNYWNKIPLFRIILPFLIGIIIAFYFQLSTSFLYVIIVTTVFGILSISYFKRFFSSFSKRWIFGVPKYKWDQIKKECHKYDIPFYNINTHGAYLIDITS